MDKILKELKDKLQQELLSSGVLIEDITYKPKGKYNFLTIVLDKVGGISLNEVDFATRIINKIVNKIMIIDDNYIIDVISKERG